MKFHQRGISRRDGREHGQKKSSIPQYEALAKRLMLTCGNLKTPSGRLSVSWFYR